MKIKIINKKIITKNLLLDKSNAFPDFIKFKKINYLVFRTAKYHFPEKNSKIVILRKKSEKWIILKKIHKKNYDLRDPKFFIFNNFLSIIFTGNKSILDYKNKKIFFCQYKNKKWTRIKLIKIKNPIHLYKIKNINSKIIISGFIESNNPKVYFYEMKNNLKLKKYNKFEKIKISGTETDFIKYKKNYYFISRKDFSLEKKLGTKIIFLNKKNKILEKNTRIKLDSPFLFIYKNKIFILARRNLFFKSRFDLFPIFFPKKIKEILNNILYWLTPKTLALWQLNIKKLTLKHLSDFPVYGDTGYAVINKIKNNFFEVYTYGNEKIKYLPWIIGQFLKTQIYQIKIKFSQ
ncbi:MAG: hypothetical protein N2593_02570 [Patescibacteria group bacterium]|nr:hypothetical protein [Patescibacteria group bacterium]